MAGKTTMLHIKHTESSHTEEIAKEDYDALLPRIKEKYKITSTKEIATPAEAVTGKAS